MRCFLSLIVPAYNEGANLPRLLTTIQSQSKDFGDFELIIVNDNSRDETKEITERYAKRYPYVRVLHRKQGNNGMGAALKEGTVKARGACVVWIMADNSDDLSTIPRMVQKILGGADMVFGSRYMKGGSSGDLSAFKSLMSWGYSSIARALFGMKVHDITNAFRAFRREVFNAVALESDDFAISPEFSIKAHLAGFQLDEVPTIYKDRKNGTSKFRMVKMGTRYGKFLSYRWKKCSGMQQGKKRLGQ